MKFSRHALLALACAMVQTLLASALQAAEPAQSARGALKTLSGSRGADYLGRVVMVEGRYGNPQPQAWRVLTLDPKLQGRLREFMVNGSNIDSERVLIAWKYGRRVPMREVKVDSKDAFLQADLAAKDAKVGFNSLDYQLIMPSGAQEPLWVVTLIGNNGATVGEVQVGAKTGVVLRKAWPQPVVQAATPPNPAQAAGRPDARQPQPQPNPRQPQRARAATQGSNRCQRAVFFSTAATAAGLKKTSLSGDAAALKETSGQILEGARRGIIRTTGSVRDFIKQALQDRR